MLLEARIPDRGRLALGMLLVVPLGALLPAFARPPRDPGTASTWAAAPVGANPIATAPSAQDIVANLTNGAGAVTGTDAAGQVATSEEGTEVGSESPEDATDPATAEIPGTAPDSALAARLRRSQSRFAPAQPQAGASTPSQPVGPPPVATPLTPSYPTPQGAPEVFPVVGGASYTNDWGSPRPGGRRHEGIDLFAAAGTPIVAISDGTLDRVGWNHVGGWRFWLRDRWGNTFYHAHLSAFAPAARDGAFVKAGTVIGFVGNTGDASTTPPHLHFEIHPGGAAAVPPFTYVNGWPRL